MKRIEETEFEQWEKRFDLMKNVVCDAIKIGKGVISSDVSSIAKGVLGLFNSGFKVFEIVTNANYCWFDDVNKLRLLQ